MGDIPQGKGSCQNFSKACEAEGVWRIQGPRAVADIYPVLIIVHCLSTLADSHRPFYASPFHQRLIKAMETSSNFAKTMMPGKASAGISHGSCPLNCGASSFLRVTTKTEEKKKELANSS